MSRKLTLWVLSLAVVSFWACSSQKSAENAAPPAPPPQFETADTVTAQAHVLSVDKANRMATLKRDTGDTVVVAVGPEVKNFDQLAAGDVIDTRYIDKLTVRVEPAGAMSASTSSSMTTAKPGDKPGVTAQSTSETKTTIAAIDTTAGTATLTGPAGNSMVVTPADRDILTKVKVGDIVVFTHTEDVAVSVMKSKKKH